ncbi:MAG: RnfABCDGE type electron transport complex subunit A [Clostridia bacterium]|nr:RnfABCDGE type electron transport complex subunit A [Clostridia bacterium]
MGNSILTGLLSILLSGILTNNFIFSRFMGICPFLGVSKKTSTAVGMGMAVTFVMTLAGTVTYLVYRYLLVPFQLEYMKTIIFIFIIAALVQFVEMALQKLLPSLYTALGIYLPLITTNCAVLGAVLLVTDTYKYETLIEAVVFNFSAALGFTLAIVLLAGVRERLETAPIPKFLKGFPIVLISAALISMAFVGLSF